MKYKFQKVIYNKYIIALSIIPLIVTFFYLLSFIEKWHYNSLILEKLVKEYPEENMKVNKLKLINPTQSDLLLKEINNEKR